MAEKALRVTSQQLIDKAKDIDGRIVVLKGEVIGDIMPRGQFVWLNIQDAYNAIGIWAPREMVKTIRGAGDYKQDGDTIEVEGQFLRADPGLGGDLCIRASAIKVIEIGQPRPYEVGLLKKEISMILMAGVMCLWVLKIFIRRKTA